MDCEKEYCDIVNYKIQKKSKKKRIEDNILRPYSYGCTSLFFFFLWCLLSSYYL